MLDYMIEGLVVVLLVVAIFYCFIIDRRLRNFKNKQMEFNPVIDHLNQVTNNTEKIIGALKNAANSSNDELKKVISEAKNIAEDLSFLVDVSNKISHTLNLQMRQIDVNNPRNIGDSQRNFGISTQNNSVRKVANNFNQNIPEKNNLSNNDQTNQFLDNNSSGIHHSNYRRSAGNISNKSEKLNYYMQDASKDQNFVDHTPQRDNIGLAIDENIANDSGNVRQVNSSDNLTQLLEKHNSQISKSINKTERPLDTTIATDNAAPGKKGLLNLLKKVR